MNGRKDESIINTIISIDGKYHLNDFFPRNIGIERNNPVHAFREFVRIVNAVIRITIMNIIFDFKNSLK